VIQYLAGAPELLDRYHNAPPAARALVGAAMDARRLGMGPALPRAFLEMAVPGYITDTDWDLLDDDWPEAALEYTAKPSKGVRGPLTPIRPRPAPVSRPAPATRRPGSWPTTSTSTAAVPAAASSRRQHSGPPRPATLTRPSLGSLGRAAEVRGLSRDAARLYKQASAHGDPMAGANRVRLLYTLHPGDQRPADWAAAHAGLDAPAAVASLLRALDGAGAAGQVTAMLAGRPRRPGQPR
jgi:hypothetical protein